MTEYCNPQLAPFYVFGKDAGYCAWCVDKRAAVRDGEWLSYEDTDSQNETVWYVVCEKCYKQFA